MFATFFQNLWDSVREWDFTTILTALVYAAILLLFIIALIKCVAPVRYCRSKLRGAMRDVKHNASESPWQDKYFLGKGLLYPIWCEYLNSRFFADNNYHNASPLEDYINEDTVINEPGRMSFSDAVPGLMVSLGFLGTLIGLMLGLTDFNMTDTDTTMSAIRQLVSGMRYAFTTSIVGIIASVLYSLVSRATHDSARNTLVRFYELMRRQAGVQAVDPLTQITIYQQEQTALIRTVAEDITGAMTERLGTVLDMALQPVQASLDDFMHVATRDQIRGIDTLVSKFVENMDAAMGHQFSNLANTLSETCRWQTETKDTVTEIIGGMKRVSYDVLQIEQLSESLISKFDGYMTRLGSSQMQLNEGYNSIVGASKAMDASAKQQFECIAQMTELQTELNRSMESFRTSTEKFEALLTESAARSADSLKNASEELRVNGDVLNDAHKTFIKGVNKELEHTFDIFDKTLTEITKQLTDIVSNVRDSVQELPGVLRDASDVYTAQLNSLSDTLRDAQRDLEDTLRDTRP